MQVNLGELVEDLIKQTGVVQALELVGEQELVEEDITDIARELRDVVDQVLVDVFRVLPLERGECETGQVLETNILPDDAG
ncbi:MAG: hypothetical protein RIG84_05950 [Roseovarius sp.]